MKIAITGATGFIGSRLAEKLSRNHHEIVDTYTQIQLKLLPTLSPAKIS